MAQKNKVRELSFNCLGNMTSIAVFDLLISIFITTFQSHMFIFHFKINYLFGERSDFTLSFADESVSKY